MSPEKIVAQKKFSPRTYSGRTRFTSTPFCTSNGITSAWRFRTAKMSIGTPLSSVNFGLAPCEGEKENTVERDADL